MSERPAGSAFLSDWYVWVTLLSLSSSSSLFWACSGGGGRKEEGGEEGQGRKKGRQGREREGREGSGSERSKVKDYTFDLASKLVQS